MSTVISAQPELPSSSNLPALSPVAPIRTANPKLYSPISGLIGHTFIRLCLWFDLLSSRKKQSHTQPVDGLLNFDASEMNTEVVPRATAN